MTVAWMLPASPRRPWTPPPPARVPASVAAAYWTVTRDGTHLRPMTVRDAGPGRDFLLTQYAAFNADDNTVEGDRAFRDFVAVPALTARLAAGSVVQVADRRGTVLGVCEMHRDGYLTLLYVRGDHQGRGLGRRLFEQTLTRLRAVVPDLARIRVRATPYALGFYRALGFHALADDAVEAQGLRFHPLELPLEADAPAVTDT
ncbi:GNAT family N-acetyltransferase [Roseospira goensis]|uniref:Ribosomal protein S18 acetylase RimI-like enzyme n=1 Tax=Roseospira goensis TaxID=391922 RepID=A0A7W6RXQ9_9PROT|nr:GNAT family N-acetyltransferase [Roseospira goensis]MBB4284996.1 ribosomal protein S18 acetylase RimI-like enzyme [Roseospira goensis]